MENEFMELFEGLPRAHGQFIIKTTNEKKGGKKEGIAMVIREPVTAELWRSHLTGKKGLGIIPINDDADVHWGAIDIDINTIDHKQLEHNIKQAKLPLIVCRSKSGGAHLYLFCSEPVKANIVRAALDEWASLLGHPGVEVFPKQSKLASDTDIGNWINMPYFGGEKTTRYAIIDGKAIADPEVFLTTAFSAQVTADTIKTTKIVHAEGFEDAPPCLQSLTREGVPEGSRNKALFNFGVLMRLKYDDDWSSHLDQVNADYFHPPLPAKEVMAIQKSLERKKYFYTCNDSPICERCNKKICKQRKFGIGTPEGDFNLTLGTLIKVLADPCYWILDVDGYRMELSTDELHLQHKFKKKCIEGVNKLPATMPKLQWEKMINDKLLSVEEQEAPPDASPIGQLRFHLDNFCMNRVNGNSKEDLLRGKPWFDETNQRSYFRSSDLIEYLRRHNFYEFRNSKEVWQALNRMGAGHGQFTIKGSNVQCWHIKIALPQTDDFEIPHTQEAEEF